MSRFSIVEEAFMVFGIIWVYGASILFVACSVIVLWSGSVSLTFYYDLLHEAWFEKYMFAVLLPSLAYSAVLWWRAINSLNILEGDYK